jgi:hypothetical protein
MVVLFQNILNLSDLRASPTMRHLRISATVRRFVLTSSAILSASTGAYAAAGAEGVPTFTPVSGWSVAQAQVSSAAVQSGTKIPCIMSGEFDNGFVMRLSGGGGSVMAMAVDFRQNVFVKGRKYTAMVSLGDEFVKQVEATAFAQNTLIFNLRPVESFYAEVAQQKTMDIVIDNNRFRFAMDGVATQLAALESCYTGEAPETQNAMLEAPAIQPSAAAEESDVAQDYTLQPEIAAQQMPRNFDDIVQQGGGVPRGPDEYAAQPNEAKDPYAQDLARPTQPSMTAAPAANTAVMDNSQRLAKRVSKTMDDVQQPQASPYATAYQDPAYNPSMSGNLVTPYPSDNRQAATAVSPYPKAGGGVFAATPSPSYEWQAFAGEDVRSVLARWSDKAGYDLQWDSKNGGVVSSNLNLNGDFKSAVDQLLAQNASAKGVVARVENQGIN